MPQPENDFYIVGIGASAGGLEALQAFVDHIPPDSGLAFVIIQHLSPDYKSHMVELLSRRTSLPVQAGQDGLPVEPNMIYLIPPKKNMTIFHGKLYLTDQNPETGLNLPIDIFLQALAKEQGKKAIAIILTGTGSDGSRGVRAIKEREGMVMVQDETAKFDGMPRSAIATQLVDFVLPPEKMVDTILRYIHQGRRPVQGQGDDTLQKIYGLLREYSHIDFSHYKPNTLLRRIERRMHLHQIESVAHYADYLGQSPPELEILYNELLIGVTRFFRDPGAFEFLQQKIIPLICQDKTYEDQIRIWVVGCSTGEEAYSLAILLRECMHRLGLHRDIKIFATDIDKKALDKASRGVYSDAIEADVSAERLEKFFIKGEGVYQVSRQVRKMVIFARQNVLTDPPFSRIDLISCRNVLIYLQPKLQKKVLSVFQFALKPDGFLFLGTSETVGEQSGFFLNYQNKWKVYQHTGLKPSLAEHTMLSPPPPERTSSPPSPPNQYDLSLRQDEGQLGDLFGSMLEELLPPCLVIDQDYTLRHAFGQIRPYLAVPTGCQVNLNVLKMVRAELTIPLHTALHRVIQDKQEIIYKNIRLQTTEIINLVVRPVPNFNPHNRLILVIFEKVMPTTETPEIFNIEKGLHQRIRDLEYELHHTRENLQATIEELETTNEELQATNEELLAANEELQSTNEELQSVNEELLTVNSEYQVKIMELTELNNDIHNLFNSTDIGTIFLDELLQIRKFTPPAQEHINLIESDIGRPFSHISHNLQDENILKEVQQVLNTLTTIEKEVQDKAGHWYLMRIFPYRTMDNIIRGVVITLVNINQRKKVALALQKSEARFRSLAEAASEGIIVLDQDHILDANPAIGRMFGYESEEIIGQPFLNLFSDSDRKRVQTRLEAPEQPPYRVMALAENGAVFSVEVRHQPIRYLGRQRQAAAIRKLA